MRNLARGILQREMWSRLESGEMAEKPIDMSDGSLLSLLDRIKERGYKITTVKDHHITRYKIDEEVRCVPKAAMVNIAATQESEREMPTLEHGEVIAALIAALRPYALSHGLGRVFAPQTTYRLPGLPDREPDASFIRRERLPKDPNVDPDLPPDVAVEVVSRSDTFGAVSAKVKQYLDAGVRMVWLINPDLRTIDVYQPGEPSRRCNIGDTLTGDPVIPGFALPVSELFTWD